MYSKQNIHLHRFCYVHTPIRETISQKIVKTALFVVNFVANICIVHFHVLSRRLVGNASAMHPVSLEPASWLEIHH